MSTKNEPPLHDKPLAAHGLTSYRYPGRFGWIMIGAKDHEDALREAARSMDGAAEKPSIDKLQIWSDAGYVDVAGQSPAPSRSGPTM